MLARCAATVLALVEDRPEVQIVQTDLGKAIAYPPLVGTVKVGDRVVLNRTAALLNLGTGGYDFVMAIVDDSRDQDSVGTEHIIKLRYTPVQFAVNALESDPAHADIWTRKLENVPVVVCQLHSQIAHVAAAVAARGLRVVYIVTDSAALSISLSRLNRTLRECGILYSTISTGQATGGDYETVTVHSALLAAKHLLAADVIVVAQGPGNAGTGTKYGFGGVEQASILDTAAALGGTPLPVVRVSEADPRERHSGVSHHTLTTLELVRTSCTIPIPTGMICEGFEDRHHVVEVNGLEPAFELIDRLKINVTTMGRTPSQDPLFFKAAAAAGTYAANS